MSDEPTMTVREAERLAALWCAGQPPDDLPQWRTAMQVLVRELSDTRAALKKANDPDPDSEYGCHVDLAPGAKPDGCVLDYDCPENCRIAMRLVAQGKGKESCSEWRPVAVKGSTP